MTNKLIPLIAFLSIMASYSCRQADNPTPLEEIFTITPITTVSSNPIIESTSTKTVIKIISEPTLRFDWPTSPNEGIGTPQPTTTAPPSRFSAEDLPRGLWIEEYTTGASIDEIFTRHQNAGGFYWGPHGGLIDGRLFQAYERISSGQAEIHANLDGEILAIIQCGEVTPVASVITAWTYKSHWIIQSYCHQEFDVYWDGVSLNQSKNYQSSFAFQLLGQEPFYLFKRNGQVWFYYGEQEILLGYNGVILEDRCADACGAPWHNENMISFNARKGEQDYKVFIGVH